VRFRLLPSDDRFFQLFNEAAANVADCARRLRELLNGAIGGLDAVIMCERRGDELIRDIMRRLNTSFVTPFDREDIHALAEQLDDVVDDVMEVGYRLELADRDVTAMPELKQQADLLVQMADETVALVTRLESMKEPNRISTRSTGWSPKVTTCIAAPWPGCTRVSWTLPRPCTGRTSSRRWRLRSTRSRTPPT
jgi:uncharacterized protein Yka (UPF0111/DUF47 family)